MEPGTLWLINGTKHGNMATRSLLEAAAAKRGIPVSYVFTKEGIDFSNLPQLNQLDMIYRVSTGISSQRAFLLMAVSGASTVYDSLDKAVASGDNVIKDTMMHLAKGVPIIPTVFDLTNDRALLAKYTNKLGGFPLIIKTSGGSHGMGVMRIDSEASFNSVADVLTSNAGSYILRKYIKHDKSARLIVIGEKVVGSISYYNEGVEFRTSNYKEPRIEQETYSEEIENAAINAVRCLGVGFGGVDILIENETNNFYVAEVNNPCYFPRVQQHTGIDIAGKLIDYLVEKRFRST